ncbi:excalibur calcium-binding domain-containing protein [Halobacillus mangrovi]|uniref:Excalibur calcium-binding domain-containing protein n=1 Tax=Halobacillus mangrovi TaxID=402384 RepID=A0A1W5ZYK3_9BACI|nr:excalibur calcium-binding domain-containing protein [Halobacillus mangrovi]ARI78307.1 hypothetical protein HM131_16330 [Halobacillus mangrovi]
MAMALFLVGFAAILSSLIYLGYYLIAMLMEKKYPFKKPLFFPLLVGGITFSIIGFVSIEESSADKLEDEILKNENLSQEHSQLKQEFDALTKDFEALTKNKNQLQKKLEEKVEELSSLSHEADKYAQKNKDFEDKIDSLQAELKELNTNLKNLTTENDSLKATIDDLRTTTASADSTSTSDSSPYYKNCTAAKSAGAAPVYAGDPGYGPHLDRDGDGVGCEN